MNDTFSEEICSKLEGKQVILKIQGYITTPTEKAMFYSVQEISAEKETYWLLKEADLDSFVYLADSERFVLIDV